MFNLLNRFINIFFANQQWITMLIISLLAKGADAVPYQKGYIVMTHGDTLWGMVRYLRIDVPKKVRFYQEASGYKRVYAPDELSSFCYGTREIWRSVPYYEQEIGWSDRFFMKVRAAAPGVELLLGKITAEGCHCSGSQFDVRYNWVLYDPLTDEKAIISHNRFGHIRLNEDVWAFLSARNWAALPPRVPRAKHLVPYIH
jgi:hypothetical protein